MAKKITGYVKLQIPAGKATPAPPVGPALGQHGVNIMGFCKEYNAKTANLVGSMSEQTQFLFISHNKIAMQMARQLIGVTMQEQGVSRIVAVDIESALQLAEA